MSHSKSTDNTLQFVLDGQIISLNNIGPTTTALNYLRETLRRTGSKEGCAEGDCGACTVVIGELHNGRIRLRAVNACIQFLATLHGKALFTIESLKQASPNKHLHPAQQAMINTHGSQCGFCTPGFVMSLFALYKGNTSPSRKEIHDHLSGNLCRCTGYKPIVQAAQDMYQLNANDAWFTLPGVCDDISEQEQQLIEQLQSITPSKSLQLQSISPIDGQIKTYSAPNTTEQLADLSLENPEATLLAGGTDVGLWVTKQHRILNHVIYLGSISELQQIKETADGLTIGAGVTLTDAFKRLNQHYPTLSELWRRFSSVQVRNAGTLGGNIANGSPIGDSMPVLITLGTHLSLRKGKQRRDIALDKFYLDYQKKDLAKGEFVELIHIPKPTENQQVRSYKLSKRFDQDISAVCAAFSLKLSADKVADINIAYGGMAATPKQAHHTMTALQGEVWNEATVRKAMQLMQQDYQPLSDMRASAEYRLMTAENLLYRFYLDTQQSVEDDANNSISGDATGNATRNKTALNVFDYIQEARS
ncbi:xanthine dehydrogenase small subunit [Leucothrix pacifica]|uniref:Xanthine dehydrogenase small subunit n=1 Tax=Leucothrix pacifica TaxID=1247513 RepID=A0A317C4Q1_9GAMM|nr:xanthine dehydrogenase small subunit [Leucothrix pacifica]PWQ92343.1 xanthine dehydrogenase small subunit [Leucothrix pacifica]